MESEQNRIRLRPAFAFRRVAALLLLGALAPAAAAPAGYYPATSGTVWRYSNGELQQVQLPRTVRGVRVTPLSHMVGGRLVSEDLLEYRPGGVFLRGVQLYGGPLPGSQLTTAKAERLSWYAPPLQIYPAGPLAAGQFWSSASGALRLTGRVLGTQPLTTASGRYNAYILRTEINASGGLSVQYSYFVPGLGVVRYQTADGSQTDLVR